MGTFELGDPKPPNLLARWAHVKLIEIDHYCDSKYLISRRSNRYAILTKINWQRMVIRINPKYTIEFFQIRNNLRHFIEKKIR